MRFFGSSFCEKDWDNFGTAHCLLFFCRKKSWSKLIRGGNIFGTQKVFCGFESETKWDLKIFEGLLGQAQGP